MYISHYKIHVIFNSFSNELVLCCYATDDKLWKKEHEVVRVERLEVSQRIWGTGKYDQHILYEKV